MSWVDDLLKIYSGIYRNLIDVVEGASEEEILQLERMIGLPFPEDYRFFLAKFGKNDGGLLDKIPMFTDISSLTLCYEELLVEDPEDMPEKGWAIVGVGHAGVDLVINLESGVIHDSSYGDVGEFFSEGIPNLVFQEAFREYRIRSGSGYVKYSGSATSLVKSLGIVTISEINEVILSICDQYGVHDNGLSDQLRCYASGNGIFLASYTYWNGALWFMVWSEDLALAEKLSKKIGEVLGATRD